MKNFAKLFVLALAVALVASLVSVFASAEDFTVEPGSDRVYFIKDLDESYSGNGTGNSAENAFEPIADPEGFDPDAQYPKYHLTTAFYQAIEMIQETGGTIVICGPVTLGGMQSYGSGANTKDVFTPAFKAPIKFTSVYDGVDYRETADAKFIITEGAEIGINGQCIWENVDIVTGNTDRCISFNNYNSIIGEGVNCYPLDDGFEGVSNYYVSVSNGHRYNKLDGGDNGQDIHMIIRSGTYNKIVGGAWGTVTANWADRDGDEEAQTKFYRYAYQNITTNITIEGTTSVLGEVCGTIPKAQPFGGNVNITINDGYFECDINGAGPTSFLNEDAVISIVVNGGDFTSCWSVNTIALNAKGAAPAVATLDCRNFPQDLDYSLASLYSVITDFQQDRVLLPDWFDANKLEEMLKHNPNAAPETDAPETAAPETAAPETSGTEESADVEETAAPETEGTVIVDKKDDEGSNLGLIIGIIAGVVVVAGAVTGVVIAKKKGGKKTDAE